MHKKSAYLAGQKRLPHVCSWHKAAVLAVRHLFRSRRQTGRAGEVVDTAAYDPNRSFK